MSHWYTKSSGKCYKKKAVETVIVNNSTNINNNRYKKKTNNNTTQSQQIQHNVIWSENLRLNWSEIFESNFVVLVVFCYLYLIAGWDEDMTIRYNLLLTRIFKWSNILELLSQKVVKSKPWIHLNNDLMYIIGSSNHFKFEL